MKYSKVLQSPVFACVIYSGLAIAADDDNSKTPPEKRVGYSTDTPAFVQPSIPWVDCDASVVVNWKSQAHDDLGPYQFTLKEKESNNVIDRVSVKVPTDTDELVRMKWKPKTNGWKALTVLGTDRNGREILKADLAAAVVERPLSFAWYGGELERDKALKFANIVQINGPDAGEMLRKTQYWEQRGVRVCHFKGAPPDLSTEEYVKYLSKGFDPNDSSLAKSLWVDELGSYSDKDLHHPNLFNGLKLFTEKNPNTWTGLWIAGPLQPSYCGITKNPYRKTGLDLLLLEAYANYKIAELKAYNPFAFFDQYIETARNQDVLENVIITLGLNNIPEKNYTVTRASIEDQIRYIREKAPEIKGVGFFKSDVDEEIVKFADSLCEKYWIAPVVNTWSRDILFSNYMPRQGEEVEIATSIFNIGGMDAKRLEIVFFDNDPRHGGNQIGEVSEIETLTPAQGCPAGRLDVLQKWRPTKPGMHEIFVLIKSNDKKNTVLNAVASKEIYVQEK